MFCYRPLNVLGSLYATGRHWCIDNDRQLIGQIMNKNFEQLSQFMVYFILYKLEHFADVEPKIHVVQVC